MELIVEKFSRLNLKQNEIYLLKLILTLIFYKSEIIFQMKKERLLVNDQCIL